jgi:hypothetical protein
VAATIVGILQELRVMKRRLALCAAAVAMVCVVRVGAAAPRADVAKAIAALEELRYREAVRLFDGAWRSGGNRPSDLRQIFALAGTAAGSMGDGVAAQAWFSRWLCLEPSARLPAGSSPKLVVLLDAARREIGGRALEARATRRDDGIAVDVTDDPLALVVAVRVGDQRTPITAGGVQIALTTEPIEIVDRYGNVLVELTASVPASSTPHSEPSSGALDDRRGSLEPHGASSQPWYARWPIWAIAAGGTAVVGGVALHYAAKADAQLDVLAQHSEDHEYSEAHDEESKLARAQWTARVAFGVAIASATVAAVCYVRGREVRTTVMATPHGASVAWSIRY